MKESHSLLGNKQQNVNIFEEVSLHAYMCVQ